MTAEDPCAGMEARLAEALLSHREPRPEDRAHADGCATCGPLLREITQLRDGLDRLGPEVEAPASLASATLARARTLLAQPRHTVREPVPAGLPEGFRGECLRLLGAALLPFPLVVAWNLALLALGEQVLGGVLPASLLSTVAVAYGAAAAGWLALVYGSIPILAHRRAQRRTAEVSS